MDIGKVYKDQYKHKVSGDMIDTIIMDIRTITLMKSFTISVNVLKFPSGKIGSAIAEGKEDHPDYHIWANFSKRGESLPSQMVGNLYNKRSDEGVNYKKGHIFDPFVSPHKIYFALFAVKDDRKINDKHIFNVVAEPQKVQKRTDQYQNEAAVPNYGNEEDMWAGQGEDTPSSTMTTTTGANIPVYVKPPVDDIKENEIPF
jgi:uncharacterized protein (DUF736 family)